jgi:hydroxypyruvate reductase
VSWRGDPRGFLRSLFEAAVDAVAAETCVPPHLPERPRGRTLVVGAGKAAAAMARVVEECWNGPITGTVVTPYGHGVPTRRIAVVEAAHPVPDAAGQAAARAMLDSVAGLGPDDLVLALISGGASALLALPAPGIALAEKQAVTRALLRSGATIREFNTVRKHLSAIKGGRLAAAAAPARVVALIVSDVPGDDPAVIGSGPTVADPTAHAEAAAILARHGIVPPPAVTAWLAGSDDTPKPGDPRLAHAEARIVASPQAGLEAAAALARAAGVAPVILGDAIEGEAREAGIVHAGIARQAARHGQPAAPPCVVLSGGETTVTMAEGGGGGGRNREFLLALSLALDGHPGIHALAADTDGIDGTKDAAGALAGPDTLDRARGLGLDPRAMLEAHDSGALFAALGDALVTGPTRTNINDFRAILVAEGMGLV